MSLRAECSLIIELCSDDKKVTSGGLMLTRTQLKDIYPELTDDDTTIFGVSGPRCIKDGECN